MPAIVDTELCIGCEACVSECPAEAIAMVDGKAQVNDNCIDCGPCVEVCPVAAITMRPK